MIKIAIVEKIDNDGIKILEENPKFDFKIIEDVSKENLIKELPKYDGLTLRVVKLDSDILSHCKNPMVIYSSVSFEPSDIFIYVTADEEKKHPDEPHSIKLIDVDKFVNNIRDLKLSIGKKTKIKMENILDKENLK